MRCSLFLCRRQDDTYEPAKVQKRSIKVAGHPTSISLEASFWDALREIAAQRKISANALIEQIDTERAGNLSSAIREFVLGEYRSGLGRPTTAGETQERDDDRACA